MQIEYAYIVYSAKKKKKKEKFIIQNQSIEHSISLKCDNS